MTAKMNGTLFLLALIAFAILLALAPLVAKGAAEALSHIPASSLVRYEVDGLEIVADNHGVNRHFGDYVLTVQQCMNGGARGYYLEPDRETLHLLCEFSDGSIGDLVTVLKRGAKQLFEKTAFPRASSWSEATSAMTRKGASPIRLETILKWLRK